MSIEPRSPVIAWSRSTSSDRRRDQQQRPALDRERPAPERRGAARRPRRRRGPRSAAGRARAGTSGSARPRRCCSTVTSVFSATTSRPTTVSTAPSELTAASRACSDQSRRSEPPRPAASSGEQRVADDRRSGSRPAACWRRPRSRSRAPRRRSRAWPRHDAQRRASGASSSGCSPASRGCCVAGARAGPQAAARGGAGESEPRPEPGQREEEQQRQRAGKTRRQVVGGEVVVDVEVLEGRDSRPRRCARRAGPRAAGSPAS